MDILCRKLRRGEINETNFRIRATELMLVILENVSINYGGEIGDCYQKVIIELYITESQLNSLLKIRLEYYKATCNLGQNNK